MNTPVQIRLHQVQHRYPDGRDALRNINTHISKGERVALVGSNGAGKTTLLLRVCGILPGTPGEIVCCELDPAVTQHRQQLPQHLGIVFQNPDDQLFSSTLLEDVAFGPQNLGIPRTECRELARKALADVGLSGFEDRSPHRLSGGEKRRAALAGVLAMSPSVLLLDEPTVFLDSRSRRNLLQILQRLTMTQIIATHDLNFVSDLCERTIILDEGTIVADGPTQVLFADDSLMRAHGLDL